MIMKTIFNKICVIALGCIGLASCNLDLQPTSTISPEVYFNEESQLQAYANNLYTSILPSHSGYGYGYFGRDAHTDNQLAYQADLSSKYTNNEWRVPQKDGSNWNFENIRKCNYFLDKVVPKLEEGKISGSAGNINHYVGEIYFLRAYAYFTKYQLFGDFPIVTQALNDDLPQLREASKRSPRNEVARFILSDLDKAIELMATNPDTKKTRINKESALLLKSRVALYEGTFLKYFKGTAFVPNGAGWPGAEKDYNKGYQFPSGSIDAEVDWFLGQSMSAAKTLADAVPLTANTGVLQQSTADAANPYFDMFGDENMTKYSEVLLWREYSQTLGIYHDVQETIHTSSYQNSVTRGLVDGFLMANGLPIYAAGSGYKGDDYISDIVDGRDNRLQLFLKVPGQTNYLYPDATGDKAVPTEPYPQITNSAAYRTGYSLRKGGNWHQKYVNNGKNWTGCLVFRVTEALLNYIEACYEKNGALDATATQYWQAIRSRAKVSTDLQATISATVISKEAENDWGAYSGGHLLTDATLYNIRRERRCELMAESLRWMDLQRWRSLDQMKTQGYHIEGFKIWGPMQHWYDDASGKSTLISGLDNPKAYVSPKDRSLYFRPYEIVGTSPALNGYTWHLAHYLTPVAIQDMLITSENNDISSSTIYQNPYWPIEADQAAIQ